MPTAWAAEPLAKKLSVSGKNPPVWPDPHGTALGIALTPLDPRVPMRSAETSPWENCWRWSTQSASAVPGNEGSPPKSSKSG